METKLCACGCGTPFAVPRYYKQKKYVSGHGTKGKKLSKIACKHIREAVLRRGPHTLEMIEVTRKAIQHYWDTISEEDKEKRLVKLRKACRTKEHREKISIANTGKHPSDKARKNMSDAQKRSPLNYYKRSDRNRGVIKYKRCFYKDIWFRSTWEVLFAKYLDKNNIKWEYETYRIYFSELPDTSYIPDFYLPNQGWFVEVKGWMREESAKKCNEVKNFMPANYFIVEQNEIDTIKRGGELNWLVIENTKCP